MVRYISLGADCQPAQQIRKNGQPGKHFFDWLEVPIKSAIRLLSTDFERFLYSEDLIADQPAERLYKVVDTYNDIYIPHDFEAFDERNIKIVQERYHFLVRKFRSLIKEDDPICFVRRWHRRDGPENEAHALHLFQTVRSKRSDANFLYLHNDPTRPELTLGNYKSAYLPQPDEGWEGDDSAWTYLLTDFAMR